MAGRLILDAVNPALDANGKVIAGSTLTFYENATTILQSIYADSSLDTPLENPLTADAAGRFPVIWADDNTSYSVLWSDASGGLIATFDEITPPSTGSADTGLPSTAALLLQYEHATSLADGLVITTAGRDAAGDGGGGTFRYDASDTTSSDNGGTIRVDSASHRWKFIGNMVTTRLFGVKAIGSSNDDTADHQSAIDAVYVAGGGTLWVDQETAGGYHNLTNALIMRPRVKLCGLGVKPKMKNLAVSQTVGLTGSLFLPGNFHPNYTQDQSAHSGVGCTYYALNSITEGDWQGTLTTSGDATHFSTGDQVFVVSTAGTTVGGFGLPDYGFLNVVTGITGAALSFKYPIDVSMAAKICRLASNVDRDGLPLFFWEDGGLENLDIESGSGNWVSDSATKFCTFKGIRTASGVGSYGNTYQDTDWIDCEHVWYSAMHEMSHNSLRTRIIRPRYFFEAKGGFTAVQGAYFQERARDLLMEDPYADFGTANFGAFTIQMADCRACRVVRPLFKGLGGNLLQGIYIVNTASDTFFHKDNKVIEPQYTFAAISRWVYLDGASDANYEGNAVLRGRFSGCTPSASDGVRIQGVLSRNTYAYNETTGAASVNTNCVNLEMFDNYIDGGFNDETAGSIAELTTNYIRRNRNKKSIAKQIIRGSIVNPISVGVGATVDIYSVNVGANMQFWDNVNIDVFLQPLGTAHTRSLVVYLYDHTTTTEIDIGTITIPASSSSGYCVLKGRLSWLFSTVLTDLKFYDPTNGDITVTKSTSLPTLTDNLDIRIKGIGGATDSGITILQYTIDYDNPWAA